MGNRVTQLPAEALVIPSDAEAQLTSAPVEVGTSPDMPARATTIAVEVPVVPDAPARATTIAVEVLVQQLTSQIAQHSAPGSHNDATGGPGVGGTIAQQSGQGASNYLLGGPAAAAATCPTIAQETTIWRYGGNSCKVTAGADGEGLATRPITICPSANKPYFSGFFSFWITLGRVRVTLKASDGVTEYAFPDGTDGKAFSGVQNTWVDLQIAGIDLYTIGATSVWLEIVADGGAATFYVDAAQITQTATQEAFFEGAGPTRLWQLGSQKLAASLEPPARYDIDVVDLTSLDSSRWPYDLVVLGGSAHVVDDDIGVLVTERIVEYQRDLLQDADLRVVLSNRQDDLTDIVLAPRQPPRQPQAGDTFNVPHVEPSVQFSATEPGIARVTLKGSPANAAVYYRVQSFDDPILPAGDSDYQLYGGVFGVAQQADYQRVAFYASLGGKVSEVRTYAIPPLVRPSASGLRITEDTGGGGLLVTFRFSADVPGAVDYWRLYRAVDGAGDGWPTEDNTQTGILDEQFFMQNVYGASDAGSLLGRFVDPTPYPPGTVVKAIAIPVKGGVTGDRLTSTITLTGTPSPQLSAVSVSLTDPGTDCDTDPAEATIAWTPSSSVVAGMQLTIYRDGQDLGLTTTDPVTTTSVVDQLPGHVTAAGSDPTYTFTYTYKLTSGANLLDQGTIGTVQLKTSCPVA